MKSVAALLYAYALLASFALAGEDPPGLVAISSTYQDISSDKQLAEDTGSALVFSLKTSDDRSHLFVLSASHVTQGKHLKIAGKELTPDQIIGRLSDNSRDIEILELALGVPVSPMASWYPQYGRILFDPKMLNQWTGGSPDTRTNGGDRFIDAETRDRANASFVLKGSWARPGAESFHAKDEDGTWVPGYENTVMRKYVQKVPLTHERYANAKITPGMSGAPLVSAYETQGGKIYGVHGVATRYLRDFPGSWFTGEEDIEALVKSYLNGNRGLVDPNVVWKDWKNVTFRSLGAYDETLPGTGSAGNQTSGDGGNQTSGDGGSVHDWDPDWFARTGLVSGMKFKEAPGSSIIAFNIPDYGNVFATTDVLAITSLGALKPDRNIPINTNYRKLLLEKLAPAYGVWQDPKQQMLIQDGLKNNQLDFNISTYFKNPALGSGSSAFLPGETRVEAIQRAAEEIKRVGSRYFIRLESDKIHFHISLAEEDVLDFSLDSQGRLLDAEGKPRGQVFQPVIRVSSANRQNYIIDLTRVFFTDVKSIRDLEDPSEFKLDNGPLGPRPRPVSHGSDLKFLIGESHKAGPVLSFRRDSDDRAIEIPFSWKIELVEPFVSDPQCSKDDSSTPMDPKAVPKLPF
jgi:hypothetical protein